MDFKPNPYSNRQAIKPSYQFKKKKTFWLNSYFCDERTGNDYTFNIRPIEIYNTSSLKVISFNQESNKVSYNIIKLKNLLKDNSSLVEGEPTIIINHNGVYGLLNDKIFSLLLQPQTIDKIILNANLITTSFIIQTATRQYPSKTYTSTNPISTVNPISTTFNGRPAFTRELLLDNTGIFYGIGTYTIYTSSIYNVGTDNTLFTFNRNTNDTLTAHWAVNNYNTSTFMYSGTNYLAEPSYLGDWIVIKFPNAIQMTSYNFISRTGNSNRAPRSFRIYVSNDGINWTTAQSIIDAIYTVSYTNSSIAGSITQPYLYYGLVVSKIQGNGSLLNFQEWEIFGTETIPLVPLYWWKLDSDYLLVDSGINNNSLTINNGASIDKFNYVRGFGSVKFSNNQQYLTYANDIPLQTIQATGGISFSFWVYIKEAPTTTYGGCFRFFDNVGNNLIMAMIPLALNAIRFRITIAGATNDTDAVYTFSLNTWYHIVWNISNTGVWSCYINGVNITMSRTLNIPSGLNTQTYKVIGGIFSIPSIVGNLDDFRIYGQVLTQQQITAIYDENTNFLLGLQIEDFDLVPDNIVSQYK